MTDISESWQAPDQQNYRSIDPPRKVLLDGCIAGYAIGEFHTDGNADLTICRNAVSGRLEHLPAERVMDASGQLPPSVRG